MTQNWNGHKIEILPITNKCYIPAHSRLLHKDGQIFFAEDSQIIKDFNDNESFEYAVIRIYQNKKFPNTLHTQDLVKNFWGVMCIDDKSIIKP